MVKKKSEILSFYSMELDVEIYQLDIVSLKNLCYTFSSFFTWLLHF